MVDAPTPAVSRIAVVGSGYWGKNLLRNFHALGALGVICDKSEEALAAHKQRFPEVETCVALSDVLRRPDIDGIAVATPAETHFPIAREALHAGKHVFVEKPLALDHASGEELIHLAGQTGRILMVGHLLQYHPVFIALKKLVTDGDLGRINYIYSHRLNLGKIRREENILWSFAPHDISMILTLADEEPETVHALGGNYLHRKIADVTTTHLSFASGLKAHIFVSWLHPFKEQKLVVVGDRKMAVFDDTLPWADKLRLYPHRIEWHDHLPVPDKAAPEPVDVAEAEPLRNECAHFLDCIGKNRTPLTDGREGLRVLRVLNASQRSLDDDGRVVSLDALGGGPGSMPEPVAGRSEPDADRFPDAFVHDSAVIDANVSIGAGTRIWHFSHILHQSRIGEGCNIGQNVVIGPEVRIGNGCKIQNNVSVYKGVTLEDGVFCGPSMVFTNVYNPRAGMGKMDQLRPTRVKKGATIGANATVICGVTIGRYAMIGAGAVVTRDVADHALVFGNPAKAQGWACGCGETLDFHRKCKICGALYKEGERGLTLVSGPTSGAWAP